MTLLDKQKKFSLFVARLILELDKLGYGITLGEAYRSPQQADLYAKAGIGIKNSLHRIALAIDLRLFKKGKYLTESNEYLEAGKLWESFSDGTVNCAWGGRFKSPDGNHFSFEHKGVR